MPHWERIDVDSSVTNALMKAMEKADRMRTVIIVYDTTDEFEKAEGVTGGVITQENVKVETINWLIDAAKRWLFSED